MKMKIRSIVDIARDQLTKVAGGVHVIAGIKNAKTGLWESKTEFEAPGPHVLGPPTIPASFTHGIWDTKKNDWLWKQEVHYKRYPPGTVDEMGRPK